jgi:hypothetical protein
VDATRSQSVALSDASTRLLVAAADADGDILCFKNISGATIQAGHVNMTEEAGDSPREVARWTAGIDQLEGLGLIKATSYKREIFELTHEGWEAAAKLSSNSGVGTKPT